MFYRGILFRSNMLKRGSCSNIRGGPFYVNQWLKLMKFAKWIKVVVLSSSSVVSGDALEVYHGA